LKLSSTDEDSGSALQDDAPPVADTETDEAPDWLSGLPDTDTDDDTPDWLTDIADTDEATEEPSGAAAGLAGAALAGAALPLSPVTMTHPTLRMTRQTGLAPSAPLKTIHPRTKMIPPIG
jgi:hypothetical protein